MQGENGRLNEVTIVCVLSINLIWICSPGGILQSYINLKDTKQLKNYIIIRSGHHHGIRSSLRPDRKQSTDTPCIYAQAPYEMQPSEDQKIMESASEQRRPIPSWWLHTPELQHILIDPLSIKKFPEQKQVNMAAMDIKTDVKPNKNFIGKFVVKSVFALGDENDEEY